MIAVVLMQWSREEVEVMRAAFAQVTAMEHLYYQFGGGDQVRSVINAVTMLRNLMSLPVLTDAYRLLETLRKYLEPDQQPSAVAGLEALQRAMHYINAAETGLPVIAQGVYATS